MNRRRPVFVNARDPLAQVFQPVGGTRFSRFMVMVNHFKSKGSGPEDAERAGRLERGSEWPRRTR